jgi:hypothetical protein
MVSRRSAAGTQLETAIRLWFEERDASSIHTLAVAANGILNQMCKEKRTNPSQVNEMVESYPAAIRKRFRSAQNLLKHGRHEVHQWKQKTFLIPEFTELVLIDAVSMHRRLFDALSPLMMLFGFRYALFNPRAFPIKMDTKGLEIEKIRRLSRREFYKKIFPRFRAKLGEVVSLHFEVPPECR